MGDKQNESSDRGMRLGQQPKPGLNLRKLVGGFMRRGREEDLNRLLSVVGEAKRLSYVIYLAMSHVLAAPDIFPAERLTLLLRHLPFTPDEVDRAMLLLCHGEVEAALSLLDAAAAQPRLRRKATVWRLYLRGRQALAEGTYASEEPIPTYQYWDRSPPPDITAAFAQWRESLAPWPHTVADDAAARELIGSHFGSDLLAAYEAAWHPAMKADIYRLAQLHLTGGLWVDADMRPAPALPQTMRRLCRDMTVAVQAHMAGGVIQNAIMLFRAGHPVLEAAIGMCIANVRNGIRDPRGATGPGVLTKAVLDYLAREPDATATAMLYPGEAGILLGGNFRASYKDSARAWQTGLAQTQAQQTERS